MATPTNSRGNHKKKAGKSKPKFTSWHHCYSTDQGHLAFIIGDGRKELVFSVDGEDDLDLIIEACEEARVAILQEQEESPFPS